MLSVLNTSSSFSTSGHMKQAGQQETKKGVIRKRTEKKQAEAFLEFQAQYLEVKVKQHKF